MKQFELVNVVVPAGSDISPLKQEFINRFGEGVSIQNMCAVPAMLPPTLQFPSGQPAVIYSFVLILPESGAV